MRERTLTFVKPGHLDVARDIFEYVCFCLMEECEKNLVGLLKPSRKQMEEFYFHTREMPFYEAMIGRYISDGLVACTWSGRGIVERIRVLAGNTDPKKAESWTIWGKFGNDSLDVAYREGRFLENVFLL